MTDSSDLLEATRKDLARLLGAEPEEIVVTRSSSEAINIVIQGLPLQVGDEVVASDQDYTAVDQVLNQRARYDGIVVSRVSLPLDPADDEEIVRLFEAKITPRTRLILVSHLVHLSGQILPAAKLCALGRRHGIPVFVDAAHSFCQIDFSVDLNCDYLCASLHKWLGTPLGSGLLYVRKLERFGNRPDSIHAGIREAVRWHEALGTPVKQARLSYLQRSWTEPLRLVPGFRVLTPRAPGHSGALGLLAHESIPAEVLCERLMRENRIFTSVQKLPSVAGVRIVPGLPTSLKEITALLEALTELRN